MAKKYYWLKLQKDFFKRHDIRIIEAMDNGKDYILFYLKLLVESVGHEGELRFSDTIPYNEQMLATITNTNVDIVRSAMKVFTELKMIEVLEDSTIYMTEVDKMIGSEGQSAKWMRDKRARDKSLSITSKSHSDIEIDIEKDIDIEIEKEKPKRESQHDMAIRILENYSLSEYLTEMAISWIDYKVEKKAKYTEKGMCALFKKMQTMESEVGTSSVIDVIEHSMANNYQGIIWDRLKITNKPIVNSGRNLMAELENA